MNNLANQFDAHVIAFDYRGFGDVAGQTTEIGTRRDARAMEAWLHEAIGRGRGNKNESHVPIRVLYGHSMGSSIATYLAGDSICGHFDGLILNGPFLNAAAAMKESRLSRPLHMVPGVFDYVQRRWNLVSEGYKTDVFTERVPQSTHVLFLHGEKDVTVPLFLGRELYNTWNNHRANAIANSNASASASASVSNAKGKKVAKQSPVGSIEFIEIMGGMHSDNYKFSAWTAGIAAFMQRVEYSAAAQKPNRHDDKIRL